MHKSPATSRDQHSISQHLSQHDIICTALAQLFDSYTLGLAAHQTGRSLTIAKDFLRCRSPPAELLREVFELRMNPVQPMPPTFDAQCHKLNEAVAATIPNQTEDGTALQFFSSEFVMEEVEVVKLKLRGQLKSATGKDGISYADIFAMDNTALLRLCNTCLHRGEAPSTWIETELIGICKKGKPKDDPNSYRMIGLESCLLKFMTMLINECLVRWATHYGLIPDSQNGFREEYRTNNNTFILQCAIDKAKANQKSLYVAFVDMTNAFPSTDQPTLWLKLRQMGAGGKAFDWLRMIYREMSYEVSHAGSVSSKFKSTIGILIGDTCSPILWNLYMADLLIGNDANDIILGDVPITNLEQADDLIILSTTPAGLQSKLDSLSRWCATNFLILNAIKSVIMIFGSKPRNLPDFKFGAASLTIVDDQTNHYNDKALKVQRVGRVICGLEALVGSFQMKDAIKLYMALVDPHLTHGCEIALDTNATALGLLEKVQIAFLRRILGLGQRSILSVLYTETGILPIRYRRILIALGYLRYIVDCDEQQLVKVAVRECAQLTATNQSNWLMSLREILAKLPFELQILTFHDLPTVAQVDALIKGVTNRINKKLLGDTESSEKLYLLRGRADPATGLPTACAYREYLGIKNAQHRKAVTRVLTSNHWYAIESLRYTKNPVPVEMRKCRLCRTLIETPEHALFECANDPGLITLRREFVNKLILQCTEATVLQVSQIHDPAQLMIALVNLPDSMNITAEYLWNVNALFDEHPLYVPT
ncbi:hypothetical protein D9611_012378 [Ephemerocybe angulata]|uniref:Reverse transcriptase domain-containing protein n=1 Tax=Ephemerocybe angulata TaxID=980116 RepID=A0A8H5CF80_9AGAR|nr:hypothetical protein D9611_012378 [Tulosesus angulatus]